MIPQPQQLQWSDKNPADLIDYSIDWINVLKALNDDTIASATWNVPSGLVLEGQTIAGSVTSAVISGGTAGQVYTVGCQITTTGGRIVRRNVRLAVKEI
jgi:hypothetical protein